MRDARAAALAEDGLKAQATAPVGMFASLGIRDFRWLWIGTVCASIGQWVQQVTLGWVVYDLTGSGTLLGAVNGMRAIAMLGAGPFAGVIMDRWDRRRLLLTTSLFLAAASAALGTLIVLDVHRVWHLFVFMFLFGLAQVVDQPLRQVVTFDLVPRSHVPNALAINTTAFSLTRAAGPGAGGLLIAAVGAGGNFFAQSGAYLLAALTRGQVHIPVQARRSARVSVLQNLKEAGGFIARERVTRMFVLMGAIPPLLLIPIFGALTPIYAKDVFAAGPQGLGLLVSAVGVGGIIGALFTAALRGFERRGLLQLLSLLGFCAGLIGVSFSPSLWTAAALMAVTGFAEQIYMVTNSTLLQLTVPDHLRARVMGLLMLNMGLMPLGALVAGIGADAWGPQVITRGMAGLAGAIGLAVLIASPTMRRFRLSDATAIAAAHGAGHANGS